MITDEMVEWAAEAIWQSEPVRSGGRRRTLWPDESDKTRNLYRPLARAALTAILPMVRAEVLEEAAKVANDYADKKLKAYADHGLVDRGHVSAARQLATAIRAMKGDAT
jgi:hypothetical protein